VGSTRARSVGDQANRKAAQGARREDRQAAAIVFQRLTGKPSTLRHSEGVAYGPFHAFLKAVFEACGVTASAEAQAKAVRRKHRSKKTT